MVFNLHKDAQSGASNQKMSMNSGQWELKEDDIVHQLIEDTEIVNHDSIQTNIGMEEVTNCHIFC
jgi:hypothetical protein